MNDVWEVNWSLEKTLLTLNAVQAYFPDTLPATMAHPAHPPLIVYV